MGKRLIGFWPKRAPSSAEKVRHDRISKVIKDFESFMDELFDPAIDKKSEKRSRVPYLFRSDPPDRAAFANCSSDTGALRSSSNSALVG